MCHIRVRTGHVADAPPGIRHPSSALLRAFLPSISVFLSLSTPSDLHFSEFSQRLLEQKYSGAPETLDPKVSTYLYRYSNIDHISPMLCARAPRRPPQGSGCLCLVSSGGVHVAGRVQVAQRWSLDLE